MSRITKHYSVDVQYVNLHPGRSSPNFGPSQRQEPFVRKFNKRDGEVNSWATGKHVFNMGIKRRQTLVNQSVAPYRVVLKQLISPP